MRTGNQMDGLYLLLLLVPFILSVWTGDYLRKKISSHLLLEKCFNQIATCLLGALIEILTVLTGIITGLLLVRLV